MWIIRESACDVYSRNRIIGIKKLTIVEWNNYKHLERITVRRDDDKLYTFKEGYYNRLRLQDIEDMLLLLIQGKLINLNIEEPNPNGVLATDSLEKCRQGKRAGAMIQAIDRQLRNIRLMRSVEKFIGGRLYGGDLRLIERTI
ncbi:hypothetical protein Tco_1350882 [Tanacetum coccineum]